MKHTYMVNFNEILAAIHNEILHGSISASYEDGSEYTNGTVQLLYMFMKDIVH